MNTLTDQVDAIRTTALLAAIELLVRPEFDDGFIVELMGKSDLEPTEQNIEDVINALMVTNMALAAPLIMQLPQDMRDVYLAQ